MFFLCLHRSKDAVKSGVHQASEIMHTKVSQASEMVHHGVHQASEMVHTKVHQAEELAKDVYERMWKACHFEKLPPYLRDNEHLHFGHRPELKSFAECFKSIFRIHTETGNIWTHLIGFVAFVVVTIIFYVKVPFVRRKYMWAKEKILLIFLLFCCSLSVPPASWTSTSRRNLSS